ncbi:alkanesulfonate monooxygenase SsuD/methylene tetrahydromethanopterin reductase-like flavin-dependent oxidoreductase (luciferase family) [Nocardiopsis mwathae]|uniref:Alkanesulfonate monooxygenase SsuD/methylene tetrahydromethanopterin reductase-like flavin-dependent oxidoreductase (Luciferase family) n=1 Tax=Nocardiopsis mwathae TaxID=1472723 RepID=A0A7W9YF63_9ACTN|nr:LLM class flavin-dependent oxidoreductase [Nocardiopsis mwathae]MBB6170326.1 alkanesulfonate monooxygenase SsuD/methylene tetrahydromethanopterin reductase-like flavin-dependent oxidoreductase (luciferase family) [Nocardiopsis mwathae]
MRIGAFLPAAQFPGRDHTGVLESTLDAAVAAEEAGFDGVWFAEHHFMSYGICPSAATLAGFVLGRTSRMHVGTAVSVLSTRHPVDLAEQANLLDQVSGGRFRLGVGRGGPWIDLEVFGTGLDRYENGFAESLDVLMTALRGGRMRADGATFGFREVEIVPGPRSRPHLDVTVAASSGRTLELAARMGLPLLLGMDLTAEEQAELLREHASHADAPVAGHVVTGVAQVADTREEARDVLLGSLPRWLRPGLASYQPLDGRQRPQRDPERYAEFLADTHAVGSPDDCVARLTEQARITGAEELILLVEGAGDPRAVLRNIRRLGAEVLPKVRAALS